MKKEISLEWKGACIAVECDINAVKEGYDIQNLTFEINGFIANTLNELENHCNNKEDSELIKLVESNSLVWLQQKLLDENIRGIRFQSIDGYYIIN